MVFLRFVCVAQRPDRDYSFQSIRDRATKAMAAPTSARSAPHAIFLACANLRFNHLMVPQVSSNRTRPKLEAVATVATQRPSCENKGEMIFFLFFFFECLENLF